MCQQAGRDDAALDKIAMVLEVYPYRLLHRRVLVRTMSYIVRPSSVSMIVDKNYNMPCHIVLKGSGMRRKRAPTRSIRCDEVPPSDIQLGIVKGKPLRNL